MLPIVGMAVVVALASSVRLSAVTQEPAVNQAAKTMVDFQERVKGYLSLQRKISSDLPKLPAKATPQQIDVRQRELGRRMIAARAGAKQGDIFGADMSVLVRKLLAPIFKGAQGNKIRAAIFDEPHPVVPGVNVRYPDDVPLSTMPPDVMRLLPKLDDEIEYRFIGRHLILLDVEAHLILDVVDNAIPG
jgi:hypothetical protein